MTGTTATGKGAPADLTAAHQALLARRLAQLGVTVAEEPAIARQPRTGPDQTFPTSAGQQRMWLAMQYDPEDPEYNVSMSLRLTGPLDVDALAGAFGDLVARHEALRTVYVGVDGTARQRILPPQPVPVHLVDLRHLPGDEREAEAVAQARRGFLHIFDLRAGPVLRVTLYRLADDVHAMVFLCHHIAIDGWSLGIAMREVAEYYAARTVDGTPPVLTELPVQYADYAVWQRKVLDGGTLGAQLDYWRDTLAAPRATLELPIARRRPATADRADAGGAKYGFSVAQDVLDGVRKAAGGASGITSFVLLLTAFKAVLARYTGQTDVTVGTLVAARTRVELEPLVGYLANPLPLRTALTPGLTFAEAVARVRHSVVDAYGNQDVPFDEVVRAVAPEREPGRHPFFQIAFLLYNFSQEPAQWTDLDVVWWEYGLDDPLFDMTLVAVPGADGVDASLLYRRELFDEADIARLVGHYRQLLAAVAADPDVRLSDVDLLTPAERRQALVDWQGPTRTLPAATFPDHWTGLVARDPHAVAVSGPEGELSYAALTERVHQLAHLLRSRGAGPGTLIGICLDRGAVLLSTLLAVWQTGAAYVPLDPNFPAERLALMRDDAALRIVVTEQAVRERLGELFTADLTTVCLDRDALELATAPADPVPCPAREVDLAYVIYTSGSTGRPKGVALPHRAVVNLLVGFAERLRLTPDDRWLAVTTLSFDIAVLELLLPLWSGARVVVADGMEVADGAALRSRAHTDRATVMQATPATWRLLLAAGGVPERVRLRLCGGEAFSRELADALTDDGATLWNVYGPTETTVWSAAGVVPRDGGPVLIGGPVANTTVHVLDERMRPVPVGVAGQLFIGGDGVARSYHGRAALTAQKFVPDPFSATPGARLYATGDLARRLPDGRIDFLGRGDHQVKIRGFRVELGEIEARLRQQPGVGDAAVTAWTVADGDTRLAGYLVADGTVDTGRLWARVQEGLAVHLPGYMVPATAVLLDALPLTPNGKVDRKALPAPVWGEDTTVPHRAPGDAVEEVLARIWQEVLGLDTLGVDSDFFALGGHSLLAERVLARVRAYFQMEAPTRVLFDNPTVAGLAAALVRIEPAPGQVAAVARIRLEIEAMSPEAVAELLGD
jgi:amino acid adenylation domain-containing protein